MSEVVAYTKYTFSGNVSIDQKDDFVPGYKGVACTPSLSILAERGRLSRNSAITHCRDPPWMISQGVADSEW
jgi:hypothetical protein